MKSLSKLLTTAIACLTYISSPAQEWIPSGELLSPNPVRWGNMGGRVAESGRYIMATEEIGVTSGTWLGVVHVFNREDSGEWMHVQKIALSQSAAGNFFAVDIAMAGEYAIIGKLEPISPSTPGSVYIYKLIGNKWEQVQIITAPDGPADYFGSHVAISGNVAVVAAPFEDADENGGNTQAGAGAAYIYKLGDDGVWEYHQKIVAGDRTAGDNFASSVAILGKHALVGALREGDSEDFFDPTKDAGAVYVFEEGNDGVWREIQKLVATDRQQYAEFGYEIALSKNTAIIGCPNEDFFTTAGTEITNAGAAYVYVRKASGEWIPHQKLTPNTPLTNGNLGRSISIFESSAAVGSLEAGEGSFFLYAKDALGEWQQIQKVTSPNARMEDYFAISMALTKRRLIVGATGVEPLALDGNMNHGAVYIYEPCAVGDSIRSITCGEYTSPVGTQYFRSGHYTDTLFNQKCDTIYHLDLTIHDPKPDFVTDTTLCPSQPLTLSAQYPGAEYFWQDGSKNPDFTVVEPGTYWVEVSIDHCTEYDTIQVVDIGKDVDLPNVITPNGDGINDRFFVEEMDLAHYGLNIYNRNGQQVFQSSDYKGEWDASELPDGVYYYILKLNSDYCSNEQTGFVHIFNQSR